MFEKFGEFDSWEEINRAAAAQLAEGDTEAVKTIALENGIDPEDAQDYIDGITEELCTPLLAGIGKIEMECKTLNIGGVMDDWVNEIKTRCTDDMEFALAVRKKGKSLKGCMALMIRFAFENKVQVNDEIVKATNVTVNGKQQAMRSPLYLGIPNKKQVRELIRKYYLGEQS